MEKYKIEKRTANQIIHFVWIYDAKYLKTISNNGGVSRRSRYEHHQFVRNKLVQLAASCRSCTRSCEGCALYETGVLAWSSNLKDRNRQLPCDTIGFGEISETILGSIIKSESVFSPPLPK
jgi:hypothetical protein